MAQPKTDRHWMRIALLWRDTLISEALVDSRAPVTIGAAPSNALVVPELADVGERHLLFAPEAGGFSLQPTHAMGGRLHLAGAPEQSLESVRRARGPAIAVGGRDWGIVDLSDDLAVFFQCVAPPERVPRRPVWRAMESSLLTALLGAVVVHFGLLVAAFLVWDQAPRFTILDIAERYVDIFVEPPPDEFDEPEPSESVAEDVGKRARDEEGVFGEPEKVTETKVPERDTELVEKVTDTGVHRALGSDLIGRGPLKNVFGDRQGFADKLSAAMAGSDGVLAMGRGTDGMGLRGTGDGGGGPGFGRVRGMGAIDTGSGGRTRARLTGRTQREKKARVRTSGGSVTAFCKEADILRVVTLRRKGIQYCYEKELAQDPELSGKLSVSWRIMLDGKVGKVLVESGLGHKRLEGCVKRQIERWRFPEPEGGMCRVKFPFVFDPGT